MRLALLSFCSLSAVLGACTDGPEDVVGPFTGTTHRYVVDNITVPRTTDEREAMADDLDGDGERDNLVGAEIGLLHTGGNVTTHAQDMIASGVIASSIEIVADDLGNDDSVSVTFYGHDGASAVATGGVFSDGVFASNRTRSTSHPGAATVVLPVFVDADPTTLELSNAEIDLRPDGAGGFDLFLRGTVEREPTLDATYASAMEMLAAYPQDHIGFVQTFDLSSPKDWVVSADEFKTNSIVVSLFTPDVKIGGKELLSFGVQMHVSPCEEGRCAAAPADTCHDRILDGDETDIDCGGSCHACGASMTCEQASDCQTAQCDSQTCAAPTCDDGVRDGFEMGVDFGGPCS